MRSDENDDQNPKQFSPLFELGYPEEEHANGEFAGHEGNKDLTPIKEVKFEEALVIVGLEKVAMTS